MKIMNVQNVNSLNVRLNMISGNLLPMTGDNSSYSIFWKIYSFLVWLTAFQIFMMIPGYIYMSKKKLFKDGFINIAITMEVTFLIIRMHARKELMQKMIKKLNDILRVDNEIMRNIVMNMIKPIEIPLKFYWTASITCIIVWICKPLTLIFQKNTFFYIDYRKPIILSKEPFSTNIFVLGTIMVVIHSIYIFTKKVSMDCYMINLILLITAQYKYIALKLSMILHNEIPQINYNRCTQKLYYDRNFTAEVHIKSLCRHHNSVIRVTLMLRELLSLNFSVIHIISIFRFCAITMIIFALPLMTILEGFMIFMYAIGGIVQLYIICSSVQQLIDASTDLTDQAFQQEWFRFSSSIKRTFMLMILANNIGFKLSTFKNYSLSLPSFMTILNQSYSIALLLLKFK